MAVTTYCSTTDIDTILSSFGSLVRCDDNQDGTADSGMASACIERGAVLVNQYTLVRYTVSEVSASSWAKWTNAVFAAYEICVRRNNPPPQSLADERDRLLEELRRIREGIIPLMGDTGPATPRHSDGPAVSNMVVDGRYSTQKVRRKRTTSTGAPPEGSVRVNNTPDYYGDMGYLQ